MKNSFIKIFALMIAVIFVFAAFAACNVNDPQETTANDESTTVVADITTDEISDDETTENADNTTGVTDETTADQPDPNESGVINTTWHRGYVGSDANGNYPNQIYATSGSTYSHTDVFTVPLKGTKIVFVDDNTSSDEAKFTSNAAYIVSTWKKNEAGQWIIDLEGANIAGTGANESIIATPVGSTMVYTYITTTDDENLRLCFRSGKNPTSMPEITYEVTGDPGTLEGVANSDSELADYLAALKAQTNYTQLEGLTMNVVGDSYFGGSSLEQKYVWISMLAQKYNMIFSSKSIGGTSISDRGTSNPIVNRVDKMPANDPQIVVFVGGRNDYNNEVPMGTNDSIDKNTFKGAVNSLIDQLKKKYPNALIIAFTPWNAEKTNSLGLSTLDYAKALEEVCALNGVPCFKSYDPTASGVDVTSQQFRSDYFLSATDVSHLNKEGHRLVLPIFEKFIAEEYAKFISQQQ